MGSDNESEAKQLQAFLSEGVNETSTRDRALKQSCVVLKKRRHDIAIVFFLFLISKMRKPDQVIKKKRLSNNIKKLLGAFIIFLTIMKTPKKICFIFVV